MSQSKVLTERNAMSLRTKIQGIVDTYARSSSDICWALYETYYAETNVGGKPVAVYEAWGYKSWHEYVGLELGLHPTTAYALKRIWEVFYVRLAGSWDVGNLLPLTKMRILCAVERLDKRNVNSWLKRAKSMTCPQLVAEVYGTEELHTFSVSVTGKEMKALLKVIEDARGAFGDDLPRGEVLVRVAAEWHAMLKNTSSKARSKLRLVG